MKETLGECQVKNFTPAPGQMDFNKIHASSVKHPKCTSIRNIE
jgi:hypothetical protein